MMKKLFVVIMLIVMATMTAACNVSDDTDAYDIITIRLNPSIDFVIDADDVVVADEVLIGLPLLDAVERYIERLKAVRFLDQTSVSVLFVGGSERLSNTVRNRIDTWLLNNDIPAMSEPITRFNTTLIDVFNAEVLQNIMALHEVEDMRYPLLFKYLQAEPYEINAFEAIVQTPIDELMEQVCPRIDDALTRFQTERMQHAVALHETLQSLVEQRQHAYDLLPIDERPLTGRDLLDTDALQTTLTEHRERRLLEAHRKVHTLMIEAHLTLADTDDTFDALFEAVDSLEIVTDEDNIITAVLAFDAKTQLLITAHPLIGTVFDDAIAGLTAFASNIGYFTADYHSFTIDIIALDDSEIVNRQALVFDEERDTIHLLNVVRMLSVRGAHSYNDDDK